MVYRLKKIKIVFLPKMTSFTILPVRVHFTFIDLEKVKNEYPKLFEKYGSYDTLGGILFDSFSNPIFLVSNVH
jgi:hypothetical protein